MSIIKKYFNYLPHFLKATSIAFSTNIILYVLLRPKIGINASGLIAELSGTLILYIFLRLSRKPKVKKSFNGIILQYIISGGTISINLIALNIIDSLYNNVLINNLIIASFSESHISFFSKLIASICGLLWTSSMTMKFSFIFKRKPTNLNNFGKPFQSKSK